MVDASLQQTLQIAADAAEQTAATDFVALDVTPLSPFTDAMLLVSGQSERNVMAIADAIEDRLYEHGVKLRGREGKAEGRWVLLDFGTFIVHVMHLEERAFYGLERLWHDAEVVSLAQNATL